MSNPQDGDLRYVIEWTWRQPAPQPHWRPTQADDRGASRIAYSEQEATRLWWSVADHPWQHGVPRDARRLIILPLQVQRFHLKDPRPGQRQEPGRWLDQYGGTYDPSRFRTTAQWRDHCVFDRDDPRDHVDTRWPQHQQEQAS